MRPESFYKSLLFCFGIILCGPLSFAASPEPCRNTDSPVADKNIQAVSAAVSRLNETLPTEPEDVPPSPQLGFPIPSAQDAFIGETGDLSCITLGNIGKSGQARTFGAPWTQCTYNTSRRFTYEATLGGITAIQSPGEPTLSAAADFETSGKYLFYQNPDTGVYASATLGMTVNTPGSNAVAYGLTAKGPVTTTALSVTKIVGDSLNLSGYISQDYAQGARQYHLLGVGAVYGVSEKDELSVTANINSLDRNENSCTAGIGYSHQASKDWTLGVGYTKTFCHHGQDNPATTEIMAGAMYSTNLLGR
jgi:hypothetical protein